MFITSLNAHPQFEVLADAVKNHDGVVDGKTDDGQNRRHHGRAELAAGKEKDAQSHQHVVDHRHHRADGEGKFIPEGHIDQDAEQRKK